MLHDKPRVANGSISPMELHYSSEEEFYEMLRSFPCSASCECDGCNEMYLSSVFVWVAGFTIELTVMPILMCTSCGKRNLPMFTKQMLQWAYKELLASGKTAMRSTPTGYAKRYSYAESANLAYDHWDYESIPGLNVDHEHAEEGFLTPVYFDKRALVSFANLPEYNVNIFSETYGQLSKYAETDSAYAYEWSIPFGFNTNGKLVFWLGDLDSIDDEVSLQLLKAYNVSSDHLLTDSEFYQAQMHCIFSEPIVERQILQNKQQFIRNVKQQYGVDLGHLTEESVEYEATIQRPVVFTANSVSHVINSFDKVLVEGFKVEGLRTLYETLVDAASRPKEYQKWQSIKLINGILDALSVLNGMSLNVYDAMSPLYILHDYRILLDHLISHKTQDETKQHIIDTLGIQSFDNQEGIYLEEISRLNRLFLMLALMTSKP